MATRTEMLPGERCLVLLSAREHDHLDRLVDLVLVIVDDRIRPERLDQVMSPTNARRVQRYREVVTGRNQLPGHPPTHYTDTEQRDPWTHLVPAPRHAVSPEPSVPRRSSSRSRSRQPPVPGGTGAEPRSRSTAASTAPMPTAMVARRIPATLSPVLVVGLAGVEPATSPLSGVRSNQLSYSPAELGGPEAFRRPQRSASGPL